MCKLARVLGLLLFAVLVLSGSSYAQTKFIFVDDNASPPGDGLGWSTAYPDLSDALADAYIFVTMGPDQAIVVVADGSYSPSKVPAWATPSADDREWSFGIYTDVLLYGGFHTDDDPTVVGFDFAKGRTGSFYNTVLDGNIGDPALDIDNTYSVVSIGLTGTATDSQRIDGFRITGGKANQFGGQLYRWGGGINVQNATGVRIENCTIELNRARFGGGLSVRGGDFLMKYCTFSHNVARLDGGGIYINGTDGADSSAHNVILHSNQAGIVDLSTTDVTSFRGGAIYAEDIQEHVTFHNCLAYDNSAGLGGAVYLGSDALEGTNPGTSWINSTFTKNRVYASCIIPEEGGTPDCVYEGEGRAFYAEDSGSTHQIKNTIIWGNFGGPNNEDELFVENMIAQSTWPKVKFSDIKTLDGNPWTGPGNIEDDPGFISPRTNDFHIGNLSKARDAGKNLHIPDDVTDLDDDNLFAERAPFSVERNVYRIYGGLVGTKIVDMGAYELVTLYPEL